MEEKILRILVDIQSDIKILKDDQQEMKQEQGIMKKSIENLEKNQEIMQKDIKNLKRNQKTIQKDITEIKEEQNTIKERQRIDGINIARILEKQNEMFALIYKKESGKEEKVTGLKVLK